MIGGDVDGGIGVLIKRKRIEEEKKLIGGDEESGLEVKDEERERIRREKGKEERMKGEDEREGENGIGGLRDNRKIDSEEVEIIKKMIIEKIRNEEEIIVKIEIGDIIVDIGVVELKDDGEIVEEDIKMEVDEIIWEVGEEIIIKIDS